MNYETIKKNYERKLWSAAQVRVAVKKGETILVALIGLAGSGAGAFGGILVSSKLTQYRLEQLERKVEVHNQVIDRVYKLEERTELQEEKIKVANHRIEDLEQTLKN